MHDAVLKSKFLFMSVCFSLFTGCQVITPVFVDYQGVRMDVAKWINGHQLMSMQQKRSLVQLAKAQQPVYAFAQKSPEQQIQILEANQIAMHCARQHLSSMQIEQLQDQIFGPAEKAQASRILALESQKVSVDLTQAVCE